MEHGDHELADIAYKHCETVRQVRPCSPNASVDKFAFCPKLAGRPCHLQQSLAAMH